MHQERSVRTESLGAQLDSLCDAFESAWQRGETPRIEDFLAGAPAEVRPRLLKELVHLETDYRRQAGHMPTREEYAVRFGEFASLPETVFSPGGSTASPIASSDLGATGIYVDPPNADVELADDQPFCGRFQILRPHARGGLGEVFVAQDGEIRRNVALKRIQERFVHDEDSRARFLREAEITGNLEHPGIVPIYGLGTDADGRPYYAMRFIQGETLKEAIERFHHTQLPSADRSLELRKLLRRFLDVCNAIDYAHSKGVIHRDLKPANIMLGKHGETLVVDWGLAKPMGQAQAQPGTDESLFKVSYESDSAPTQIGQAVGTPQYMSPEQAAGRHDALTAATDIYALGGVLHSILAGKPPVAGKSLGEVLQHVQQGKISVLPATSPRPPASICRKAMALDPSQRYPSVRALADDVEKWLADERVSAHQESLVESSARWARTHRAAVAGAAALTLTAVVALMIGLIVVSAEQQRTAVARENEAIERKRADDHRIIAEQKRLDAEQAQKRADDERAAAEWTAYLANLQAADAEWERDQAASAYQHLESCSTRLRGWEHRYLTNKFCRTGQLVFSESVSRVNDVAFSPDGKRIAVASSDPNYGVTIWDASSRRLLNVVDKRMAFRVTFAPDGKRIAVSDRNGAVKLWDADLKQQLASFDGLPNSVSSIAFNRDGTEIVIGSGDGKIRRWDVRTKQELWNVPAFSSVGVWCLQFSPDDKTILGSGFGSAFLLEAESGREVRRFPGHFSHVRSARFTPNGQRIITSDGAGVLRIWDASTDSMLVQINAHSDYIAAIAVSSDGRKVASGGADRTVKIWDSESGRPLLTLRGHTKPVSAIAFDPTDKAILSGGLDAGPRLWDAIAGQESRTIIREASAGRGMAINLENDYVASGDGLKVKVWNPASGAELKAFAAGSGIPACVVFGESGKTIIAGFPSGVVKIWEVGTGELIGTLSGHSASVNCLSLNGKYLISGSDDKSLIIWDLNTRLPLKTLTGHSNRVTCAVVNSDATCVASGSWDCSVKIWDVTSGEIKRTIKNPNPIYQVAFTSDGRSILCNGPNGSLTQCDLASGEPSMVVRGHGVDADILDFAVNPAGDRIVTASIDRTLKLWDVRTGAELLTLRGHIAPVNAVCFSKDGSRIISNSADQLIKIWDSNP